MAKQKIIIDTDPGVDDTIAIVTALGSKELDVLGIVSVGGNVPATLTQNNARGIVAMSGRLDIPVYAGTSKPLKRDLVTAADVHGENGVNGLTLPKSKAPLQKTHGVDFIIDTLRASEPGSVKIAALGPLTNIATALQKAPDIADRIGQVVVMGGAFGKPGGNITPHAEFNIHVDPDAAKIVFDRVKDVAIVPLDTTHQTLATKTERDAIRGLDKTLGPNLATMLDVSAGSDPDFKGADASPQHDSNVVAYMLKPEIYKGERGRVSVETEQPDKLGKTTMTPDPNGNVTVLTQVDSAKFFGLITERIGNVAKTLEAARTRTMMMARGRMGR